MLNFCYYLLLLLNKVKLLKIKRRKWEVWWFFKHVLKYFATPLAEGRVSMFLPFESGWDCDSSDQLRSVSNVVRLWRLDQKRLPPGSLFGTLTLGDASYQAVSLTWRETNAPANRQHLLPAFR